MRKSFIFAIISVVSLQVGLAGAQMMGSGTGYSTGGQILKPAPVVQPAPPPDSGIIQFNNLTVQSVSGATLPAEIVAGTDVYIQSGGDVTPQPMVGAAGQAVQAPSAASHVTSTPSINSGQVISGQTRCLRYENQESNIATVIPCPIPTTATSQTNLPQTGSAQASTSVVAPGTPTIMPVPPVYRGSQYRIEVSASTRLMLRDRTQASITDFAVGDQINVFGTYNDDGTIDALIVRNISKPEQKRFIQLNNADLVSVSLDTNPVTLAVIQQSINPCYDYGPAGATKQNMPCPLGIKSFSDNPATKNISAPQSLMPIWDMAKKYIVSVDSQTIIMDRNRGKLAISDLKVGDKLNIYGETTGNAEKIDADIVRDLSQPAIAENYSGRVTQVNADGSFVIQTDSGETYTVQSPIQVGATVQLKGLLDQLQKVISQVSQITIKNSGLR